MCIRQAEITDLSLIHTGGIHINNRALVTHKNEDGTFDCCVEDRPIEALQAGEVLVQVRYSSLNYKDALSANGHPGVSRVFPHVTGIDAIGTVVESNYERLHAGDRALITGFDFGMNHPGGHQQYVAVPGEWVVKVDALEDAHYMLYGTAGLTAALSVYEIVQSNPQQEAPILVTGATGGVGSVAVALLAQLGYRITAMTGKTDQEDMLKSIGATEVVNRDALAANKRPMLSKEYGGVIDTVGGEPLAEALKRIRYGATVTCCGLTSSADLHTSVYPFILRSVRLIGIDSVLCSLTHRQKMWQLLENEWRISTQQFPHTIISLDKVVEYYPRFLAGTVAGRIVIQL